MSKASKTTAAAMDPAALGSRVAARDAVEEVIIRAPNAFVHINLLELWRFRGILWRKVTQRIRVQYDDMWLGFFWAVARPVIMVLVFWAFRGLSEAKTGVTIPYPLYVFSGIMVWFYFTEATVGVAMSLKRDAGLIQKVYFPRLISPLSHLLADTYSLALAAVPLAIMMLIFGEYPGWHLIFMPLVLVQIMLLALGLGMVFSALVLASRDWERFLKFALYTGLWISPVIYSVDMIPKNAVPFYLLNPMGGSLLAVRATFFDNFAFPWGAWGYALCVSLALVVAGLLMFQRSERTLADRL